MYAKTSAFKKIKSVFDDAGNPLGHFKFVKQLAKGNQGVAGIVKWRDAENKNSTANVVYKFSLYNDYTVANEKLVMKSLVPITTFCHNFPLMFGSCTTRVRSGCSKREDPFTVYSHSEYVEREVLFTQYIKGILLKEHIFSRGKHTSVQVVMSLVKQTLLSVMLASACTGLTHYDLHSMNIITPRCRKNLLVLYVLSDEEQFLVPTYGYYPVIIDYGFSYSNNLEDGPLRSPLFHTHLGYTCNTKDELADFRVFLVSVMDDLRKSKYTGSSRTVKDTSTVIQNIFNKNNINWETGWLRSPRSQTSVAECVCNHLESLDRRSRVFTKHMYDAFGILQTLVVLPLETVADECRYTIAEETSVYKTFIDEWLKFEKLVLRLENCLSILKIIVETVAKVRPAYIDACDSDDRATAALIAKDFASFVAARAEATVDFCVLDDVNFERLLEACIDLGEVVETLLCRYQSRHCATPEAQRKHALEKVLVSPALDSPSKIFTAVDVNAETPWVITGGTPVMIIDCVKKSRSLYTITSEDAANLKKIHRLLHGQYIYKCHAM